MSPEAFLASLGLAATGSLEQAVAVGRPWIRGVSRRVPTAVLPALTVDLGTLVTASPEVIRTPERTLQPELRTALGGYAEHVVGRFRRDPVLRGVRDALSSAEDKTAGVVALLGRVMDRLATNESFDLSALGETRRRLELPDDELLEAARDALGHPEIQSELAAAVLRLVAAAKRQPALLEEADAFVVRHLAALETPSEQLAFAQMMEAASALARGIPRRFRRRKGTAGRVATEIADDAVYPIGGYAAIANTGPIENLVSSELVYLEPDPDGVELFDLRYVTNELLKYTRDEGVFHRPSRTIDLILDAEVLDLRVKVQTLPFQVSVMARAAAVVAVFRLAEWLRTEALVLRLWIYGATYMEEADEELTRFELALADAVASGVASVARLASFEALSESALWFSQESWAGQTFTVLPDGRCAAPGGPISDATLRGWTSALGETLLGLASI